MDHNGKELALLISGKYKELYPKGGALYFYSEGENTGISAILRNIYDKALINGVNARKEITSLYWRFLALPEAHSSCVR